MPNTDLFFIINVDEERCFTNVFFKRNVKKLNDLFFFKKRNLKNVLCKDIMKFIMVYGLNGSSTKFS